MKKLTIACRVMFQHMWYTFGWNVCLLSSLMGKWGRKLDFEAGDLKRLKVKDGEVLIRNMQEAKVLAETHP